MITLIDHHIDTENLTRDFLFKVNINGEEIICRLTANTVADVFFNGYYKLETEEAATKKILTHWELDIKPVFIQKFLDQVVEFKKNEAGYYKQIVLRYEDFNKDFRDKNHK